MNRLHHEAASCQFFSYRMKNLPENSKFSIREHRKKNHGVYNEQNKIKKSVTG